MTPEQERLLEDVASGELAPDTPAVLTARRDPAFAAALDAILATADRLTAAAANERAVLAVVRPRAGRGWPVWIGLAAATLLCGVAWFTWSQRPRPPEFLGGDVQVDAAATDYAAFTFASPLPTGGWFEITVRDQGETLLHREPKWTGQQWRPADELRRGWPEPILVQVRMFDGQGDRQGDGSLRCWRQSGG